MSNRRRARKVRTPRDRAMESATVDMLHVLDGRSHPRTYTAPELREMIVADMVSGWHAISPPHLWFCIQGVRRIGALERKGREDVTKELLAEAEALRPGSTLT